MNQGASQNWLAELQQLIERIKELEKENAELRKRLSSHRDSSQRWPQK